MKLGAYFRLMRFHKPAGTALLWFPTAWALWVAGHHAPPVNILIYFLLGTIIMRAAGCVVNDMADRHIDKHVSRTKNRPLTTGEVNLSESWILLFILLCLALWVVIQLPILCFYYAIPALILTLIYPFFKRFFQAPQLILGLAFSMGIPMAYASLYIAPNTSLLILFIINFLWIIAYDTMYAMADRYDDIRIGVNSTARLFGQHDLLIIGLLQVIFHGLWLVLAINGSFSIYFYVLWCLAIGILLYQQYLIYERDPARCLKAFSINSVYGLILWLAVIYR